MGPQGSSAQGRRSLGLSASGWRGTVSQVVVLMTHFSQHSLPKEPPKGSDPYGHAFSRAALASPVIVDDSDLIPDKYLFLFLVLEALKTCSKLYTL